jgi:membrane fusion protein (multidrug efflux system)
LLPPDNATGNFTKVVQRIPVKILVETGPRDALSLRAGMSVVARVHIGATGTPPAAGR